MVFVISGVSKFHCFTLFYFLISRVYWFQCFRGFTGVTVLMVLWFRGCSVRKFCYCHILKTRHCTDTIFALFFFGRSLNYTNHHIRSFAVKIQRGGSSRRRHNRSFRPDLHCSFEWFSFCPLLHCSVFFFLTFLIAFC